MTHELSPLCLARSSRRSSWSRWASPSTGWRATSTFQRPESSEISSGKRSITADTALRLERYFGVSAQFWLNLQSRYDLKLARRKLGATLESRIRELEQIPA